MGRSLLIVEDDLPLAELLGAVMSSEGWTVRRATTLSQARDVLDAESLCVVLVAGHLSDGSGIDFLAELRQRREDYGLAYMSPYVTDIGSYDRLRNELAVTLILRKPFRAAELVFGLDALHPCGRSQSDNAVVPIDMRRARTSDSADAHLGALRNTYRMTLAEEMRSLAASLEVARNDGDPAALNDAIRRAQRIHGTAATYGLGDIRRSTGDLETLLEGAESGAIEPDAELWRLVNEARDEAERSLVRRLSPGKNTDSERPTFARIWNATVLVVSPDPEFLVAMARTGLDRLVRVLPSLSETEALDIASRFDLDAAVFPPRLASCGDAFRLCRRLRALPGLADLPLIAVSATDDIETRLAAVQAGAALCLTTPVDPDVFAAAVYRLRAHRNPRPPRVLIVDDDAGLREQVAERLGHHGIDVVQLAEPARIIESIRELRPDVVLLDVVVSGLSGFDVCRAIRVTPEWRDLSIIMITGRVGPGVSITAFEAGADDCVAKPLIEEALVARVLRRAAQAREVRELTHRDALTGQLTRTAFSVRMSARMSELARRPQTLALAMVDLDDFKKVNDQHGHATGDQVLAAFGQLLRETLRKEDLSCRWGGEEFVIAYLAEDAEGANIALLRLLDRFRSIRFEAPDGSSFQVGFSAGVAMYPDDGASVEALLRLADERLYQAKAAGKGRVVSGEPVGTQDPAAGSEWEDA